MMNFTQVASSLASGRNNFDKRCAMDVRFLDDQIGHYYFAAIQRGHFAQTAG